MTRIIKDIVIPAAPERIEKDKLVEIKCDLCDREAASANHYDAIDYSTSTYEVSKVGIFCEEGNSYPEGGSTKKISFDICTACFHRTVIPALTALGAKPNYEERDW